MCNLRLNTCQALAISKRLFVATVNREAFCYKVYRRCWFLPWRSLALNIYFICACTWQSAAPVEHCHFKECPPCSKAVELSQLEYN